MKGTLHLRKPVLVNGKQIQELAYDTDEITATLFSQADARKRMAAGGKNVSIIPAAEFDFSLHLYLGFAGIIAVNAQCDFADMERISGQDLLDVMGIGRNFMLRSEDSPQSNFDAPYEIIAEPSTPASSTLETDG